MVRSRTRLLAVTHESTRTGAPMMLLHLLEWLRDHRDWHIEVLSLKDGPLLEDFARVGTVHRLDAFGTTGRLRRLEQGLIQAGQAPLAGWVADRRLRWAARHLRGFDLLYCNSATSALALGLLPELPARVVSHVHELDSAFNRWLDPADRARMLEHTDEFIVAADCVGRNLVDTHGVPAEHIWRCYEFVQRPRATPEGVAAARARLGLAPDELVVGSVGTADWRKGCDLYLQMAAHLRRIQPDRRVRFVWVGHARPHDADGHRADVAGLGLDDVMTFTGEVPDPASYLALFDVFCLTSREDPYPLVCLEAGAMGIPIVSFHNGGMVELAAADPPEPLLGIVGYLDVEAMAASVSALLDDPEGRRRQGARLADWVTTHHLVEVGAPEVAGVLDGLLGHRDVGAAPTSRPDLLGTSSCP